MNKRLNDVVRFAKFMIVFSVFSLSTTAAEIVVYLVLSGVLFFVGNRFERMIKKLDYVADFCERQAIENGHMKKEIENLREDMNKLETDLTGKVTRIETTLNSLVAEIRKHREA